LLVVLGGGAIGGAAIAGGYIELIMQQQDVKSR
jgi:hypothetical protein